jgi:uncharacterized membrane protein YeiH
MPAEGAFNVPPELELAAVFLFAITGALLAITERYDIVGVFALALITAIGGGLVRDGFFLQHGPPLVLQDERYLYAVVLASALCLVLGTHLNRLWVVFLVADALGLGIYAVVGAQRALDAGLHLVPAAFVGVANAIGSSVLRDVLTRKETLLFKPGEFYVLAAMSGTAVFLGLGYGVELPLRRAAIWSIATTFAVRVAAVAFNWTTSAARPLLGSDASTLFRTGRRPRIPD